MDRTDAFMRVLDGDCVSPDSQASKRVVKRVRNVLGVSQQCESESFLYSAVYGDCGNLVRCCLLAGVPASVSFRGDGGETPAICAAAQVGACSAIAALLAGGADVSQREPGDGMTALHNAAHFQADGAVRLLLAAGASVDARDGSGKTPLHLAAVCGAEAVVRLLVASPRAPPLSLATPDGFTALHLAAEGGSAPTVCFLLSAGAQQSLRTMLSSTPLHLAAQHNHPSVVAALVSAGAELEARDSAGRTPLYLAAMRGSLGALTSLLSRGASAGARNSDKLTPLMGAVINHHPLCVRALHARTDLSATEKRGVTALHMCCSTGSQECFDVLLPLLEDVDIRSVRGSEPLVSIDCTPLPAAATTASTRWSRRCLSAARRGWPRTAAASRRCTTRRAKGS